MSDELSPPWTEILQAALQPQVQRPTFKDIAEPHKIEWVDKRPAEVSHEELLKILENSKSAAKNK